MALTAAQTAYTAVSPGSPAVASASAAGVKMPGSTGIRERIGSRLGALGAHSRPQRKIAVVGAAIARMIAAAAPVSVAPPIRERGECALLEHELDTEGGELHPVEP